MDDIPENLQTRGRRSSFSKEEAGALRVSRAKKLKAHDSLDTLSSDELLVLIADATELLQKRGSSVAIGSLRGVTRRILG